MDNYHALDITDKVKKVLNCDGEENREVSKVSIETLAGKEKSPRLVSAKHVEKKHDQMKIKQFGKTSFSIGKENVDLKYVEQLLDSEQTTTLSYCLRNLVEKLEKKEQDLDVLVEKLWEQIQKEGLCSLCEGKYLPSDLAQVRKMDIYACVNRYRGLR